MEGVGARLGRSSTRYGPPSTVFNGPVRKWKKKWVHVSPSSNNASSYHHSQTTNHKSNMTNGNNGSHIQLYKWTPISQSQNNNNSSNGDKGSATDDVASSATNSTSAPEEPPRRKFKYIPISMLEEQNNEAVENEAAEELDDEAKLNDTDSHTAELISKNNGLDEKPDINDVPMEEIQAPDNTPSARQDLNERTLDLSL